ncbi:MAG: carbonic anhydrase [Leptolyngbyaceae cyanobacterium RU_5_1]|nr:carbonic anhydrase [Leptolyngbyaceae cyanobacterium RU_5_1]
MQIDKRSNKFSRRTLIAAAGGGAIAAGLSSNLLIPSRTIAAAPVSGEKISADKALKLLMEGNQRYSSYKLLHPRQDEKRLIEVAKGQNPFAIILTCADSRVCPEIIFDQGLGDLFVVRVAGNVVNDMILGSIEYAAGHLGALLIMVLGHERCGAVAAAVEGAQVPAHISSLVKAIQPAVETIKGKAGDSLDNAIRANVQMVVAQMKTSEPLAGMVKTKNLQIVGGRYDLDKGAVEIIT